MRLCNTDLQINCFTFRHLYVVVQFVWILSLIHIYRRSSVPHLQQTKKGLNFMSILQTIDLKKYYGTEPNITRALDGVNFSSERM